MSIILVGLNYRTAPIEIREQFSLAQCALQMALEELRNHTVSGESRSNGNPEIEGIPQLDIVILSTCQRVEVYADVEDPKVGREKIEKFLSQFQSIPSDQLQSYLYFYEDRKAIEHLMRVASGLDSMNLGEPQVLGQVTKSYLEAQKIFHLGATVSQLFSKAIHTGKRARNETNIGRYTTSVGHAGARVIQQRVDDLPKTRVLLVGAGEMAEIAVRALKKYDVQEIKVINRTFSRANQLAQEVCGEAIHWNQLLDALTWADVVLSATDAPHIVIQTNQVEQVLPERENRPLLMVDIAFPRDLDPGLENLDSIELIDIDDLKSVVDANMKHRKAEIPHVEKIIEEEIEMLYDWLNSRELVPVLTDLRSKIKNLVEEESQKALRRIKNLDAHDLQIIQQMTHRISNQILHEPTTRLKESAANGDGFHFADTVRALFNLDK